MCIRHNHVCIMCVSIYIYVCVCVHPMHVPPNESDLECMFIWSIKVYSSERLQVTAIGQ